MIGLAIQTLDNIPTIYVLLDVVDVDIPALIGLDVLEGNFLMVDNISNRLWHRIVISNDPLEIVDKWWVPLIRDKHHLYVLLHVPMSTFYTTQHLRKLHRQFAYPSPIKLYVLLKRAGLEAVDNNTLNQLEKIVAECDLCQRIRNAPYRLRITLGQEHTRFNSKVYTDLMHIEGDYVLHPVDEATRFSAANFVCKRVTTEKVWEAIIQCWSSVYTGMPYTIAVDEGTEHHDIIR